MGIVAVTVECNFNLQGPSGLGLAIVEESRDARPGIYIRSITFGGVADRDTRLSVGDHILEVQDKNLQDVHYDKVYYLKEYTV